MRDLLVVGVAMAGAFAALKRPYFGALLWVWIGLMNPHRLGWGFAYTLPLAQVAVIATLIGMVLHPKDCRWVGGAPLNLLIALTTWMGVTTAFAILLEPSASSYWNLLKVVFMTIVVSMLVRTREEIIGLVWTVALSIGFYGVKGGIFTVLTGGSERVWGPPESLVNGNNEVAVALVMVVPLLYFLASRVAIPLPMRMASESWQRWVKIGLYVAVALCVIASLGSQSRGALLAVTAMTAVLWWRSGRRWQFALVLGLLVPVGLMYLPESWYSRMETIGSYDQDQSAMGRINAWTMAVNIARDRLTGAGFATASPGIYALYAPNPDMVLVAHSIYFQMLGEHGFIGLLLYILLWVKTYAMASDVIKSARGVADLEWASALAGMVKVSLVGFAVGGAFLSLAYWDMPLYLLVIVSVLAGLVTRSPRSARNGRAVMPTLHAR